MNKSTFAKRLKESRISARLTQAELSKISGVTAATISAYESSDENKGKNPSLENAVKLAQALKVSLDWLCGVAVNNEKIQISDFLKMLVKINDTTFCTTIEQVTEDFFDNHPSLLELTSDTEVNARFVSPYPLAVVSFDNHLINNFLIEWSNMKSLRYRGTIDDDLYNLWLNKQFETIDKEQMESELADKEQTDKLSQGGADNGKHN